MIQNFLLMNGDAIFDFNLEKIYKEHEKKSINLTFLGCENELAYGTIGILNKTFSFFITSITWIYWYCSTRCPFWYFAICT